MLISMLFIIITVGMLFFIPLDYFTITAVYLYMILILWEIYREKLNMLDVSVLIVYVFIAVVYYIFHYNQIIPFTGSIFYAALTFACLFGFLFKMPFTLKNRKSDPEELYYHRIMNLIMALFYSVSLITSIVLFPESTYIYVPLIIVLISIPGSVFATRFIVFVHDLKKEYCEVFHQNNLQLLDEVFGNHEGFFWISGKYISKKVVTEKDKNLFFEALKKGYHSIYLNSTLKNKMDYEHFFETLIEDYEQYEPYSWSLVVVDRDTYQGVGTIRLVMSSKLPMEKYIPVGLDGLRKHGGKLAEVGRFTIIGNGVEKAEIAKCVFFPMLPTLLKSGVDYLLTDAVENAALIYKKIGFEKYPHAFFDNEVEQQVHLWSISVANLSENNRYQSFKSGPWMRLHRKVYFFKRFLKRFFGKINIKKMKNLEDNIVIKSFGDE